MWKIWTLTATPQPHRITLLIDITDFFIRAVSHSLYIFPFLGSLFESEAVSLVSLIFAFIISQSLSMVRNSLRVMKSPKILLVNFLSSDKEFSKSSATNGKTSLSASEEIYNFILRHWMNSSVTPRKILIICLCAIGGSVASLQGRTYFFDVRHWRKILWIASLQGRIYCVNMRHWRKNLKIASLQGKEK